MPKNHRVIFTATDTQAVALTQSKTGAGPLLLNGTSADTREAWVGQARFNYFGRQLTITSANNLSAVTFTIVGLDVDLNPITETIAGPNATTVTSVNFYNHVTSVSVSASVTAVSVGDGSTGTSRWIPLDVRVANFYATVNAQITGTINYTVNHTFDNILDPALSANPQVIPCPTAAMVGASTNQYTTAYNFPTAAIQFVVNSSAVGTLIGTIIEQGINS